MKLVNTILCAALALVGVGGYLMLDHINSSTSADEFDAQRYQSDRVAASQTFDTSPRKAVMTYPPSTEHQPSEHGAPNDSDQYPLVPEPHYLDAGETSIADLAGSADEKVFNLNPNTKLTNNSVLDSENWDTEPGLNEPAPGDPTQFRFAEGVGNDQVESESLEISPMDADLDEDFGISDLPDLQPEEQNPDEYVFNIKDPSELAADQSGTNYEAVEEDDLGNAPGLPEEFEVAAELQLPSEFSGEGSTPVIDSINDETEMEDKYRTAGKNQFRPNEFLPPGTNDPTWWIEKVKQPQLRDRQAIRLTLDQAIFEALNNAPQVQILNTQPQIQQTVVEETDAAFDWNQFVNSSWREANEPIGSSLTTGVAGLSRFVEREWTQEFGLDRQLRNGSSFGVGQTLGTLDNNSSFLDPIDQGNARLVLDYRQPFMRGRGRSIATSQVALARLDLEQVESDSLAELQNYLIEVVSAYWEVYLRRVSLVQRQRSQVRAEQLLRLLRHREGIDVKNDQILRAEAAIASRQSAAISAEFELMNSQDRLINLTSGPNSRNADRIELVVDQVPFAMAVEFASEEIIQAALRNRQEVRGAIARIRVGSVRKHVAANELLPRLDAVLQSYVSGVRGDRNVGGSLVDQFSAGDPSYSVGFQFEVPLGNRAAKSRYARSELEAQIFQREFDQQVGDVVLDARVASREIRRLNRENQNNWGALSKALEELNIIRERQRLNLDDNKTGSLYIEDLLASQARLSAAEERFATSQAAQAIAVLDLKRATGHLLNIGSQNIQPINFQLVAPPDNSVFGYPNTGTGTPVGQVPAVQGVQTRQVLPPGQALPANQSLQRGYAAEFTAPPTPGFP